LRSTCFSIRFKKGCLTDGRAAILKYQELTRAEMGCDQCDLWIERNSSNAHENEKIFILFERWINSEALDEHCTKPHYSEFREALGEFCAFADDSRYRFVQ
jgi:quinol monooxygenase YgiN